MFFHRGSPHTSTVTSHDSRKTQINQPHSKDQRKRGRAGEAAKREGPAGGRHEDSGGQAAEVRGRADGGRGEVRGEERVAGSPGEGDGRAGIMGWRILNQGH